MENEKKCIEIIGVPSDLGANIRGSNLGPNSLRISELQQKLEMQGLFVCDGGNLEVPLRELISQKDKDNKYLAQIISLCKKLSHATYDAMRQGRHPLTVGGDHSIAIGSISGVSQFCLEQNKKLGLIWFDAHADLNTPKSSPSGNIHGMPLSTLLGEGFEALAKIQHDGAKLDPECVALIGIRSVDDKEKEICRKSGILYYSMMDIEKLGMRKVMAGVLEKFSENVDAIHVSFDIDGMDPYYAPGVSTPEPGGLNLREAKLALEMIAQTGKVSSSDFVELNPITDINHKTAHLMTELILTLHGKTLI